MDPPKLPLGRETLNQLLSPPFQGGLGGSDEKTLSSRKNWGHIKVKNVSP